uniref:Beta-glucosidase n=1 Tax=uncultured bacterium contig00019 TaxID=1181510 RepID=A0A806JZZ4_9BACT|nr:beta-glucosidase [uncultured bacterium contig00019]
MNTWLRDNLASPAARNYLELQADGTWGVTGEDVYGRTDNFHYRNAPEGAGYFVNYSEGIYVGYKYFETRHDTDPGYNYYADVMFPFGHGLSYTAFDKNIMAMNESDGVITVRVSVTNTGNAAGKDVIQIYYNPPYTGAIEKSTVNLVSFRKTNIIAPGQTEYYSLTFNVEDMASYDYANNGCYVLERGPYEIMLRENAHVLIDSETYTVRNDIVYNDAGGGRTTDHQTAVNQFSGAYGNGDYLTRAWNANSRAFTGPRAEDFTASQEVLTAIAGNPIPTDAQLRLTSADMPPVGVNLGAVITLNDMSNVDYDDPKWNDFVSQLTLEELASLSGNGAWTISEIARLGVPLSRTPDGATSIGSSIYSGAIMGVDGNGVTYPIPVVIASTWNTEIAYIMGKSIAMEGKAIGFNGWYAPAMNTHRTPFSGRNFEYYSEDGFLAGMIAANVVEAVAEEGFITFIKHFALNDRETNCRSYLFTWSNEQAIREIYLKPFELAVKLGGSMGAMSSFNFIGATWAGAHEGLLTQVLRNEWGMKGLVITDAAIYPFQNPVAASYAGGNLHLDVMAAWNPLMASRIRLVEAANDNNHRIGMTRNLQRNAKNILYAVSRTWYITGN